MSLFYPKYILHSLLLLCLLSWPSGINELFARRDIAAIHESSQILDELLSFKLTGIKTQNDLLSALKQYANENAYHSFFVFTDKTRELPKEMAYKMIPRLEGGSYKIEIQYSQNAISDYYSFVEIKKFISLLTRDKYSSRYHFFELFYNAKKDHAVSLFTLSSLRKHAFDHAKAEAVVKKQLEKENEIKTKYWQQRLVELKDLEKNQRVKTELLRKKRISQHLDIKNKNIHKQLQELAANNNRKGVANLLSKVLPWEAMAPLEKRFFKDHLEYIKNPLPLEKRVLIFRGIDNNTVFLDATNSKQTTINQAMENGSVFFVAHYFDNNNISKKSIENLHQLPMLTDNFSEHSNFYQRSTPLTSFFDGHAVKSENSPFISTTSDLKVAYKFGKKRLAMFAVDPRSLYFNYASRYIHETEFLIPFLNFPDEIAGITFASAKEFGDDLSKNQVAVLRNRLEKSFIEILSKDLDEDLSIKLLEKIKQNSRKEFNFINDDFHYVNMNKQLDKIIKEVITNIPHLKTTPMQPVSKSCVHLMKNFIYRDGYRP